MRVARSVLAAALFALLLSGCMPGESKSPMVTEARIGLPTGPNAALYFTANGYGESDGLVSVDTDAATETQLHESVMGDDGTMSMQPLSSIPLDATNGVVLEPGGYHVMLLDVERLDVGELVAVTITWEQAGPQTIEAEVVEPQDAGGEGTG
jgi:periplasmic copper chaperone A